MRNFSRRGASLVAPGARRCLGVLCMLLCGQAARAESPAWEQVRRDDGIVTWVRERPGEDLPTIRSRVVVRASLWEPLAVLDDVERACEWTAHCVEMRRVEDHGPGDMLVYAHMDVPWPARDRDVVTRVTSVHGGPGQFVVKIRKARSKSHPPRDGVVRMPELHASYRFQALGPGRTEIVYEAAIDPGGALPGWLKRLVSRDFPHDTLERLRKRVRWSLEHEVYASRARVLEAEAVRSGFVATR